MKYKLGDLTVKHWNSWDRVPRMPEVFVAAAASAGVSTTTIATIGSTAISAATIVGYVAYTAVTSWALQALAPKPDFGAGTSSGILVNAKDVAAPQEFVYGEVRKGGAVTYYETTGANNKYLHQIIVLAGHEVNSIGDIYLNDEVVTIDGSGYVTSQSWNSKVFIRKFTGASGQNVKSTLDSIASFNGPTLPADFRGDGIACLYVRYEYNQDAFPNGIPLVTAKVQGKKVYDPRTSTTAYSNNAALCIRDFISSSYGLADDRIDDTSFQAAANECDEDVTLSGGGTEDRYTINGIIKADRNIGDVLQDLTTACAGTLFWGAGLWKLKVGAYSSPVKTLTLDDLRGPIALDTRITMRDNFNTVSGTFIDAEQDYITVDYPQLTSATFKAEDGGEEVILDLPLPYTTSAATAQRLAKLTLFRGREQMTLSADFGLEAFETEVGDIIAFTNDRYGFSAKEFEVVGWRLAASQDAGDLRINLTLRETSSSAFDWDAEETAIISNNTTLPNYYDGLTISNLSISGGGDVQRDGTFFNSAIVSWDEVSSAFVNGYEVQWKPSSDSEYASSFTSESSFQVSPILDDVQYDFRVRATTVVDNKGAFSSTTYTSGGDTTAPSAPTSLTATAAARSILLNWTNPTDVDFNTVNIYEKDAATPVPVVGTDTPIASVVGQSHLVENILPLDEKFYWVTAVDHSGNESVLSSSASATADFLDGEELEDLTVDTVKIADDAVTSIVTFNASLPYINTVGGEDQYADDFTILSYVDDVQLRPNIFGALRYKVTGTSSGSPQVRLLTSIALLGSGGSLLTLAQTETTHTGSDAFGEFMHNITYDSVLNSNGSGLILAQAYVQGITSPTIVAQGYGMARRR